MEVDVEFYATSDGKEPAKEFLLSLDVKMRAKMARLLSMLADNGNDLRAPYSKSLGDGIFELRAQADGNISRELYFFYSGGKAIITNGFVKKTQNTPPKEIELAKKYRKDYIE